MNDESQSPQAGLDSLRERQAEAWQRGERLLVESLVRGEMSQLSENELLELIFSEVTLRAERREVVHPEEYVQRFPRLAEAVKRLFALREAMEPQSTDSQSTSVNLLKRLREPKADVMTSSEVINDLIDQFQREWDSGSGPRLVDFVRSVEKELRSPLAQKLIPIDVQRRIKNSDSPSANDYAMFGAGGIKIAERAFQSAGRVSQTEAIKVDNQKVKSNGPAVQDTVIASGSSTLDGDRSMSVNRSLRRGPDPSSRTFGRFELKSILGKGSFGEVHKAWDPHLERFVALKIPLFDKTNKKQIARFLSEAKSTARLKHQNIVATLESGTVGDQLYIASELIEGERLSERLARRKLSVKTAVKIAAKLADALAFAHENNVVHRDIKPENIILDAEGEPHIMDFGLAKRTDDEEHLTTEGALLGTPAYMSPEQARGENHRIGPQSDQYSLAVVLYHMLSGKPPHDGPAHSVVLSVAKGDIPSLRLINRLIDRKLETIVSKALALSPDQRYPSSAEFASDLAAWESGNAIQAVSPPKLGKFGFLLRRFGPVVALSIMLLASLGYVAFTGYSWMQQGDSSKETSVTEPTAKSDSVPIAQEIVLSNVQVSSDGTVSMVATYIVLMPVTEPRQGVRTEKKTIMEQRMETFEVSVDGKLETRTREVQVPREVNEAIPFTYTATVLVAESRQMELPSDRLVLEVTDNGELQTATLETLRSAASRPSVVVSSRADAEKVQRSLVEIFGGPDRRLYLVRDESHRYELGGDIVWQPAQAATAPPAAVVDPAPPAEPRP